jgi:hypothetical protein
MAKSRRNTRRSRKAQRKSRKAQRKSRVNRKMYYGGQAPVNYSNPGPMNINLAQGKQFDAYHANQHGGGLGYGPYPGAVDAPTVLPADLTAAARLLPLNDAFAQIRGMTDQDGGRRRRRGSRKSRKSHKKQRGGDFVRWGGARRSLRKGRKSRKTSRKGRKGSRKTQRGGSYSEMRFPMPVSDETKMLIPASLQAQAGLNPEWKLAENPLSFAPY